MSRRSKTLRSLAWLYELTNGKPEVATAAMKDLYRAISRQSRRTFYKALEQIERDYKNGLRYWAGE